MAGIDRVRQTDRQKQGQKDRKGEQTTCAKTQARLVTPGLCLQTSNVYSNRDVGL